MQHKVWNALKSIHNSCKAWTEYGLHTYILLPTSLLSRVLSNTCSETTCTGKLRTWDDGKMLPFPLIHKNWVIWLEFFSGILWVRDPLHAWVHPSRPTFSTWPLPILCILHSALSWGLRWKYNCFLVQNLSSGVEHCSYGTHYRQPRQWHGCLCISYWQTPNIVQLLMMGFAFPRCLNLAVSLEPIKPVTILTPQIGINRRLQSIADYVESCCYKKSPRLLKLSDQFLYAIPFRHI